MPNKKNIFGSRKAFRETGVVKSKKNIAVHLDRRKLLKKKKIYQIWPPKINSTNSVRKISLQNNTSSSVLKIPKE